MAWKDTGLYKAVYYFKGTRELQVDCEIWVSSVCKGKESFIHYRNLEKF